MPEEEKIRRELVVSVAEDRLLLKKGEDRILDLLTNSRGMILDDIELIESLKIYFYNKFYYLRSFYLKYKSYISWTL